MYTDTILDTRTLTLNHWRSFDHWFSCSLFNASLCFIVDAHIHPRIFDSFITSKDSFTFIHMYDRTFVRSYHSIHSYCHIVPPKLFYSQYSYHVGFYVGSSVHYCTEYPRKYNPRTFQYWDSIARIHHSTVSLNLMLYSSQTMMECQTS